MSKLVPVVREDKNGKSTTRWVKEPNAGKKETGRIPAPKVTEAPATPRLTALLATTLQPNVSIDQSAAARLEQMLDGQDTSKAEHLQSWIRTAVTLPASKTLLHDLAALAGSINYRDDGTDPSVWTYITGVHEEPHFQGVSDFWLASPRKLEEANAYVYASSRLGDDYVELLGGEDEGYSDDDYEYDEETGEYEDSGERWSNGDTSDSEPEYMSIYDRKMVNLILSHPSKVESIVAGVANGVRDLELLREQILHPQQAFSSGVL